MRVLFWQAPEIPSPLTCRMFFSFLQAGSRRRIFPAIRMVFVSSPHPIPRPIWWIRVTRAGLLETTFAEETETDLFGEQAVLCGGVSELVKAAFETLVEAGYQPEVAYFECLHELKLIVDLFYRGGLNYMRYSVSDTAEHGDYVSGNRIVNEETRFEMSQILKEIQDGTYAQGWIDENKAGRPWFNEKRRQEQDHMIERVGADLRDLMPFIDPVTVKPGQ